MNPTGYFLDHLWLIPLFPLATAALMLFFGKRLPKIGVSVLCVGSVGLSFIHALGAVSQLLAADPERRVAQKILFEWLTPGSMQMSGGHLVRFVADWGFLLDPLSAVMVLVVTGVGFLIHVYSVGYMGHEGGYYRFFGYMNLFMFAMLTLVLANNLLLVGAAGKSAQIPLYVWLPDAMEGPTPVSALIHAATMVTAGVYMVVRMNAVYQLAPFALDVVAVIGAVTAVFAASMALVQNDIKKILAYSTISQLGYMFLALGVGAFAAGIFHLMTHAFFKALLFLGAGSV